MAIDPHHSVSKTCRILRKAAHVSLLIDAINPCSQGAGKTDLSEDAVLPDESIWRGCPFGRNAADAHGLPPIVDMDDGGAGRAGVVNSRENVVDHEETVPSRRMLRIVAIDAAEIAALVNGRQAREPGAGHVVLLELAGCR